MRFLRFLNKPHPFIFNWYSIIVPALITFLVIIILRPFEFSNASDLTLLFWSFILALIVGLSVVLSVWLVKKVFPLSTEEQWSVGKEIALVLFVLAVILLAVFLLMIILNPETDPKTIFRLVALRTFTISVFPVLIMILFEQFVYQNSKRREAENINRQIRKKQVESVAEIAKYDLNEKIVLRAENQKIALRSFDNELVMIKSEGNYVEVFYESKNQLQKELIRNSLKAIEEQLSKKPSFYRCHKQYIINLNHIQKVNGNARNLELIIEHLDAPVPVSRSKSEELLVRFK